MKEYPNRDTGSEMVDVCECGHESFWHRSPNLILERGACVSCTCPKFKYEQQLTRRDADKLKEKIFLKQIKDGFSQ